MTILDIDHLMMDVTDQNGVSWFERAGFTVRPLRAHSIMGGGKAGGFGGSAVVAFSAAYKTVANYFELSFADQEYADPTMARLLPGRPLLSMAMHATDDFKSDLKQWEAEFEFGLQFDLPMAERAPIRSQTIHAALMTDERAPLPFGMCQYEHVDEYKLEALVNHPNGARGWRGLKQCLPAEDFARQVYLAQALYGRTADEQTEENAIWRHNITYFEIERGARRTEVVLDVTDQSESRRFLAYTDIDHETTNDGIRIMAEQICGADLILK